MKAIMNIEEVNKCIDKIKIYKFEEDICFDDIKTNMSNIDYDYMTGNKEKIDNIEKQIISKLMVISKIHENNIFVLNKNVQKYIETSSLVENKFDKIL